MSPISIPGKVRLEYSSVGFDSDAATYIAAVEAADGQPLEYAVTTAIQSFVIGCKADGIWNAIKASCILAGARTLAGALVPLKGTAPTNNNFVSSDYNRKTGLVGNGSTKYLNSNRNNNADPQNSKHISLFANTISNANPNILAGENFASGSSQVFTQSKSFAVRLNSSDVSSGLGIVSPGFVGVSRNIGTQIEYRINGASASVANASAAPTSGLIFVFSRSTTPSFTTDRLAFYSIGESLDLALLDARVSALMSDIGAAIP